MSTPSKPRLLIYRPGPPLEFLDTYDPGIPEFNWTADPKAAYAMTPRYVAVRLSRVQKHFPDAKSIEQVAARVLARRRMT